MVRPARPLLLLGMLTVACSGGGATSTGPDEPATGTTAPPEDESDYDRKLRLAKEKREQCDALATAIEGVQGTQAIININDAGALRRLAGKLEHAADMVAAVNVTVAELRGLRDQYVDRERGKATALEDAAGAKAAPAQRSKLSDYQRLDNELGAVIDDINAFCGATATE